METNSTFNYSEFGAVGILFYWMDQNPRAGVLLVWLLVAAAALAALYHNFTTI